MADGDGGVQGGTEAVIFIFAWNRGATKSLNG
jgi:hypothetical protein